MLRTLFATSLLAAAIAAPGFAQTPELLTVRLVANAGVEMSDGETTVLVDLPYRLGDFDYSTWEPDGPRPVGPVISAITHAHADHFAADLVRPGWRVFGSSAARDQIDGERAIAGRRTTHGEFEITAHPTPHSEDHVSIRVEWRGWSFWFTGDTEEVATLEMARDVDVLFGSPWIFCLAQEDGHDFGGADRIVYHLAPARRDRICAGARTMAWGESFDVEARGGLRPRARPAR